MLNIGFGGPFQWPVSLVPTTYNLWRHKKVSADIKHMLARLRHKFA